MKTTFLKNIEEFNKLHHPKIGIINIQLLSSFDSDIKKVRFQFALLERVIRIFIYDFPESIIERNDEVGYKTIYSIIKANRNLLISSLYQYNDAYLIVQFLESSFSETGMRNMVMHFNYYAYTEDLKNKIAITNYFLLFSLSVFTNLIFKNYLEE